MGGPLTLGCPGRTRESALQLHRSRPLLHIHRPSHQRRRRGPSRLDGNPVVNPAKPSLPVIIRRGPADRRCKQCTLPNAPCAERAHRRASVGRLAHRDCRPARRSSVVGSTRREALVSAAAASARSTERSATARNRDQRVEPRAGSESRRWRRRNTCSIGLYTCSVHVSRISDRKGS